MANRIRVHVSETIIGLYQQGWRKLRIAHELGVDVKTVRKHIREAKSLLVPTGDGGVDGANSLIPPAGTGESNSLVVPAGRQSQCEAFRDRIEAGLERGLTAQRLYQDLVCEEGFEGGYDAVKRFTRRLRKQSPQRFYRFEREPGEEAQVDFGRGAPVVGADGRRKNTHVFRRESRDRLFIGSDYCHALGHVHWNHLANTIIRFCRFAAPGAVPSPRIRRLSELKRPNQPDKDNT